MKETLREQDACEETCKGTKVDVQSIGQKLLDDAAVTELANIFKALGDPTRVKMIHALLQSELCVHDISEVLGMGQSAVSHQLRLLRNLRIVKRRKVGKTVYYSLDDSHVEEIFIQTLQHLKHV
ncbi:ArsR/SmtB family transcription factor [Bacillus horti]|uniref:DNA-binding transcriptional ArsR family regulator n=1 Tax=Caldalkalibacillus horti TaxID=77523 RepID=A0ABT9VXK1_9BACI|nr:metalloregulator ArsR/SmtB family transcription factor [Bacillus horti]MDQ0165604.1 DNA-binding transcriptional ArsR family regulator [Bacillus horti]